MSEIAPGQNRASQSVPDPAAGGTPPESDLPILQGVPGVDVPSDDEGANLDVTQGPVRPYQDSTSGSDPAPNTSGFTGA